MSYQLQQFSLESVHLTLQDWQTAVQDDDLFALEYQDLFKWTESHIQYEDKHLESYAYGIFTKDSPNTAAHAIVDIIQRPHGRRQTKLLKLVVSPQFADDTDVNNLNTLVDLMLAAVYDDRQYAQSLSVLNETLLFIQSHPFFELDGQRYTVELVMLSAQDTNNIWTTLGGQYYPSVMCKLRRLVVDANEASGSGGIAREPSVNISK